MTIGSQKNLIDSTVHVYFWRNNKIATLCIYAYGEFYMTLIDLVSLNRYVWLN